MRYKLVSDNDGHDYIIPSGEEGLFYQWVEAMENGEGFSGRDYDDCRVNHSGWTFSDPQGWQ